jgi:hypothetical protein
MDGGTTFHFVTGGIREALARARDVRLGYRVSEHVAAPKATHVVLQGRCSPLLAAVTSAPRQL